jgi:hypothetical protein
LIRIRPLYLLVLLFAWSPVACGALVGITGGHGVISEIHTLDPNSGAVLGLLGSTGISNASGIAFHPITGDIYIHQNQLPLDNGKLYRVDPVTFNSTLLGETHMSVDDLAFAPDGTLYGWMEFHDGMFFDPRTIYELVTFDLTTGVGAIRGGSDLLTFQNGLAFNSNGDLFLKGVQETRGAGNTSEFHSEIFQINPATGVRTHVKRLHDAVSGVGFDTYPNDVLVFDGINQAFTIQRNYDYSDPFRAPVFVSSFLQRIDLTTGAVTTLGGNLGLEITGLAFTNSPSAVPEPNTLIALTGLLASAWGFRRRFRPAIHPQ